MFYSNILSTGIMIIQRKERMVSLICKIGLSKQHRVHTIIIITRMLPILYRRRNISSP
jgi:hypothetical protein